MRPQGATGDTARFRGSGGTSPVEWGCLQEEALAPLVRGCARGQGEDERLLAFRGVRWGSSPRIDPRTVVSLFRRMPSCLA